MVTLALSVGAISFSTHLSTALLSRRLANPRPLARPWRHSLTVISVLLYAATLPAYFRMSASYRHQATAALLFSYPGTLTRYLLSTQLNPRMKALPLGTFTANALGTALLGTFHVLQGKPHGVSPTTCSLLQGLADGYCGCLTTVSTFATELVVLEEKKRWRYLVVSWVAGQLLLLVILGPSYWAGNVSERMTCHFVGCKLLRSLLRSEPRADYPIWMHAGAKLFILRSRLLRRHTFFPCVGESNSIPRS